MPKMLKFWIFSSIWVLSLPALAQKTGISGYITTADGKGILNSSILVVETSDGAVSDSTGYYHIPSVRPGKYTIIISHVNYDTEVVKAELREGETLTVSRQLVDRTSELAAVEITGKTESQELREKPFHVNVIDVQPLQQKNLDITRVLTQVSGVRVRQNAGLGSSFDLTLNGFKAAQFINGIPVDVYGSAYAFNSIPLNQVDRIEVFKGVVPVHLGGDALGGAVNIITRNKIRNNLNVSYAAGSFNTHKASVQGMFTDARTGFVLSGSAFFNYSDNSYEMKNMVITDTTTTPISTYTKDVRRFHDDFLSYAAKADVGVSNKKFADVLLAGVGFSGIRRDLQTGSLQYPAIGEATGEEDNHHVSLRYSKHGLLNKKLDLDGFLLLNTINFVFVDTSSRSYQWDGTVFRVRTSKTAGELGDKQIYRATQKDFSQRYNIAYHITPNQSLTLNVISGTTTQKNTDPNKVEGTSVDDNSSEYSKMIIGLGHDMTLWDEKLRSTAYVKYYRMDASIDSTLRWRGGYFDLAPMDAVKTFTGGGLGFSYIISDRILAKVSAEYACRLPTTYELLGDGISTVANVSLKPEVSMNYNLGFSSKLITGEELLLTFEAAGFYRKAKDFIRATAGVTRSTHINYDKVLVRGAEGELKLVLDDKLAIRANATYQQVLDDNKYIGGSLPNYTYGVQLPNTPYFFGNFDAEYRFKDVFSKLNIIPYYNLLYVNEFYLGYENIARGDRKYTIPMQLVQDIGITASGPSEKYSVSLECSNIMDEEVYDNFRLQKPGRAFNFKITYFIN